MKEKTMLLIVDDEQVVIDSVTKICESEGLYVDSGLDAHSGLKKLEHTRYELIICDIMMPDMDGFQFMDIVKEKNIKTPIVITTGYSTVENAVRSLNEGAIDFLAKPFTVDELISVVKRGLQYKSICIDSKSKNASSISYVDCPVSYFCLGYAQWAFPEIDGTIKIGATDLFLRTIKEVEQILLLEFDDEIVQGNPCTYFKTKDENIHILLSPVTGRIVRRNELLLSNPALIVKDPFFEGWIYSVIPADPDYEFKKLTSCSSVRNY
jgi:CheY-like chemotaxis protein/glycine cleavage system H lipoate-binding protein